MEKTGIEEVTIPTAWNGLNREQLIAYAQLFYPYRKKLINATRDGLLVEDTELFDTILFGLLFSFLGLPPDQVQAIDGDEVHRLLHQEKILHFLWETYDLDNNLIITIDAHGTELYGPTDFAQLTFEEMRLADEAYVEYFNTNNEYYLNRFISLLYRERNNAKYGDLRISFSDDYATYILPKVNMVPTEVKVAAMIWYECQRELVTEEYKECFSGTDGQKESLHKQLLKLSQGIVNFDAVRNAPALIVYADIQRVIIENRKRKHENQL